MNKLQKFIIKQKYNFTHNFYMYINVCLFEV